MSFSEIIYIRNTSVFDQSTLCSSSNAPFASALYLAVRFGYIYIIYTSSSRVTWYIRV